MTSYLVAVALTTLLFVTFVALRRRGCDDDACGTHEQCPGCPHAKPSSEHSDD